MADKKISLSLANRIRLLNKASSVDVDYGPYDTEQEALDEMIKFGEDGRIVSVYSNKIEGDTKLFLYNRVKHELIGIGGGDGEGNEKLVNKQDNLDEDGTGVKYPTVDAINDIVEQLRSEINASSGDKNFVWEQGNPSDTWVIPHPLNKQVSVSVLDSAGTYVYGEVTLMTNSLVIIKFTAAFSGSAVLN